MADYWNSRLDETTLIYMDKTEEEIEKELARAYRDAANRTVRDINNLYNTLLRESENGVVKPNDLYKYDRYFKVLANLNAELLKLGQKEIQIYNNDFLQMYEGVQEKITEIAPNRISVSMVGEGKAQDVLKAIWCADNKHWSERVWGNMGYLQETLQQGLVDVVERGGSVDDLTKTLMARFNVSFNDANRVSRTELNYIRNQAAQDRYEAAGLDKYEFMATIDDKTCDEDRALNGKIFYYRDKLVGVNFPPIHPNCRCSILPVIERGK